MLRTIKEIIQIPSGIFRIRLSCGHMSSTTFINRPLGNGIYKCQRCEIKGQGISSTIGHLNRRTSRKK